MDYMKQERLSSADLIQNSANRVPVCLCVDASYSMLQDHRIDHVNNGIRSFIQNSAEDAYVCDSIDLCIITFSGQGVQILQPFTNVKKLKGRFVDIVPSGGTPMGAAVRFAVEEITRQRDSYEAYGITSYRPWLILMSDGAADDSVTEVARRVREMQQNRQLKVKCIGMGSGEESSDLAAFTLNGRVESCGALEIEHFFDFLSRSAAGLSTAAPGEEDQYDIDV